jgi:hypothetical protein
VSTPELQPGFWRGVRQEALAGIVVLAVGSAGAGIFYLCYTVPTKLDDVLSNQQVIQKKVGEIEDKVYGARCPLDQAGTTALSWAKPPFQSWKLSLPIRSSGSLLPLAPKSSGFSQLSQTLGFS